MASGAAGAGFALVVCGIRFIVSRYSRPDVPGGTDRIMRKGVTIGDRYDLRRVLFRGPEGVFATRARTMAVESAMLAVASALDGCDRLYLSGRHACISRTNETNGDGLSDFILSASLRTLIGSFAVETMMLSSRIHRCHASPW